MFGSTESIKKIIGMRTFKVQSDNTLKDVGTKKTKSCSFIREKKHCDRECTYYNELERDKAGMVICRCLEKVMGFVTKV